MQALENITEALRNVVPPIPPYELPERVNALRRSFGPGSIPNRGPVEDPMLGGRP